MTDIVQAAHTAAAAAVPVVISNQKAEELLFSILIQLVMNTRGLMELIVLNIGFEAGFIPQKVFTMLVIMAIVTTLMAGPFLKVLMPRLSLTIPRNIEA